MSKGFTLLEVIIVVVITSIIIATGLPLVFSLSSDARAFNMKKLSNTIESVATGVFYQSVKTGVESKQSSFVYFGGKFISTNYGFPTELWQSNFEYLIYGEFEYSGFGYPSTFDDMCFYDVCVYDRVNLEDLNIKQKGYALVLVPHGRTINSNCYAYYANAYNDKATQLIEFSTRVAGC